MREGAETRAMLHHKGPRLTVDVVLSSRSGTLILIRRKFPPFQGMWALPGGFVETGETLEEACLRETMEECGVKAEITGLVGVYSDPARDPRGHTVSVVFAATAVEFSIEAGDDAAEAREFTREELDSVEIAFDHRRVLADAGWID